MKLQPPQGLPFIKRLYDPNLVAGEPVLLWAKRTPTTPCEMDFHPEYVYSVSTNSQRPCRRHAISSTMPELVPGEAYIGIVETIYPARTAASGTSHIDIQYVAIADLRHVLVYQLICPRIPNTVVYTWTDDWIISRRQIPTIPITKVYRFSGRIIETIEFFDHYGMVCREMRREFEPDLVKRSPKAFANLPELTERQYKTLGTPFVTPRNLVYRNKWPPA